MEEEEKTKKKKRRRRRREKLDSFSIFKPTKEMTEEEEEEEEEERRSDQGREEERRGERRKRSGRSTTPTSMKQEHKESTAPAAFKKKKKKEEEKKKSLVYGIMQKTATKEAMINEDRRHMRKRYVNSSAPSLIRLINNSHTWVLYTRLKDRYKTHLFFLACTLKIPSLATQAALNHTCSVCISMLERWSLIIHQSHTYSWPSKHTFWLWLWQLLEWAPVKLKLVG